MTAEEILSKHSIAPTEYGNGFDWLYSREEAIKAMEEYAQQQCQKELKDFAIFFNKKEQFPTISKSDIDEYLKSKL